jgi:hypothetical protein
MKRKIAFILFSLLVTFTASAQFEQDKVYVGGSLTGLNLSYNGLSNFNIGLQAQAGYMVDDDLLVLAQALIQHNGTEGVPDNISVGVGGRYYIEQNGIYLGVNCKLLHANHNYNDIMPGVEIGYAFFISRTVTIEPAIYYDQSFKKHSDYSTFGLKVGIGVYL